VPLKGYIQQSANLGAFVAGLFNSDLGLIGRSLTDILIEPQRASLIPHFYKVKEAALLSGALGCSISGAGPSIFALCANSLIADSAGDELQKIFADADIDSDLFISPINQEGTIKL
jgi:homoserine kinase